MPGILEIFYRDLKLLVKNAIWKCDLKMRKNAKKTFFHVQIRWCWMWNASWNFNWKVYFLVSEILWLSYLVLITQNTSLKSTSISVHCHNVTWKSGKISLLLINRAAVLKAIYCFRHCYLLSKHNMNDEAYTKSCRNLSES